MANPDLVVHGGDLAASGNRPAEVVDRIRELGWPGVVGNTDEMLWAPEEFDRQMKRASKLRFLLEILFHEFAPATHELLGGERIQWLRALPPVWRNEEIVLAHASPSDLWQAPMPNCEEQQLIVTYGGLGSGVAVYGHIHRPSVR